MKRLLVFACFILVTGLSSCQCAEKPPMSPVEGEETSAITMTLEARV